MRLNSLNFRKYSDTYTQSIFKERFKRDFKKWTINELYTLYEKTLERSNKRKKDFSDFVEKVINEIKPDKNKDITLYYENEDGTYLYKFRYDPEYNWSYRNEWLKWDNNKSNAREQKLDLLLANQKAFEMGNEMHRLEKLRSSTHRKIFHCISELVNEELNLKFKKVKNHNIPEILRVNISNNIYFVKLTDHSRSSTNSYKHFQIISMDLNDEIINI
jgi:hypothetical protein